MNQIVNNLISALGFTRRGQAANDPANAAKAPLIELQGADFALIVGGGDGDNTGPRGGWIAATLSVA